ncbi:MAG: exported nucleotide-binding protein [Myxococcaceae bacterium]|nr:exported nucleotide-binding protein [Myxococcaceae bacterium]
MRRVRLLVTSTAAALSFAFAALAGCGSFEGAPAEVGAEAASEAAVVETGAVDTSRPDATAPRTLTPIYARSYGSTVDGGPGTAVPTGMLVDTSGGVIIAGSYADGPIDVGNHALPAPVGGDAFLVQLDGSGDHVASSVFGDGALQMGGEVVGSGSRLFASYYFGGTIFFDADAGAKAVSQGVGTNANSATARFGPPFQFGDSYSFTSGDATRITHLAAGASGSVITFGDWKNAIKPQSFGSSQSRNNAFPGLVIARILGSGVDIARADYCPAMASCFASALGSNTAGEALVGGHFTGTITGFDGGADVTAPSGDDDAYLMKLDPSLNPQWLLSFGGLGSQEVTAIAAVPATSDFVVAGIFHNAFTVAGQAPMPAADGGYDMFVVRVDGTGKVVWAKTFGGGGDDIVRAITVDKDANVFLVGDFHGPNLSFGGDVLVNADAAVGRGTTDVFLAWLDGAGKHVYSSAFGSTGKESPVAVGVDGSGNILVTGSFDEAIDFGAGEVRGTGATNMFVARLAR